MCSSQKVLSVACNGNQPTVPDDAEPLARMAFSSTMNVGVRTSHSDVRF